MIALAMLACVPKALPVEGVVPGPLPQLSVEQSRELFNRGRRRPRVLVLLSAG